MGSKLFKSLFFIGASALAVVSCDHVSNPSQIATAPVGPTDSTVKRKILLEDFTGHHCGNCPKAVDTIHAVEALYPNQVVSVGIHSGFFSTTSSAPYTYNFVVSDPATPGYNELDNFFQISAYGNPNGMINRKDFNLSTTTHVLGIESWRTYASLIAASPAQVKIDLEATADTGAANSITATIDVKFLEALTGTFKLATMIIEDSVIKPQKDYRFNPDLISNYAHRHVLRGYMYGSFGEQIGTTDPAQASTDSKTYTVTIPSNIIRKKKCGVIAYVYDASTYEVLQTEVVELFH